MLPRAVELLDKAWSLGIVVAFGMQQMIDDGGAVLEEATQELNRKYFRTSQYAGVQKAALESAFRQQMPNDGFLISTNVARRVGYRSDEEVGVYCDLDFTLRLAATLPENSVVFVDENTAQYRLSGDAISADVASRQKEHSRAAIAIYESVRALPFNPSLTDARNVLMGSLADKAVKGFALTRRRYDALRAFFSDAYPWSKRLSRKGLYHLAIIIQPAFDKIRPYT